MDEELLNRLVEALEGIHSELSEINNSLDDISETVNDCTRYAGKGKILCIAGDVITR